MRESTGPDQQQPAHAAAEPDQLNAAGHLVQADTGKLGRLREPHVAPLNQLVARWRSHPPRAGCIIPWFDPDDGGVAACVLLLLEAPAPATARLGNQAVCSEDNNDSTNRALRELRTRAGLDRGHVVKWNIVPWASPPEVPRRPLRACDVAAALPALREVTDLLPSLQLVITLGARAAAGYQRLMADGSHRDIAALTVPHPSQRNARRRAESLAAVLHALEQAAALARQTSASH